MQLIARYSSGIICYWGREKGRGERERRKGEEKGRREGGEREGREGEERREGRERREARGRGERSRDNIVICFFNLDFDMWVDDSSVLRICICFVDIFPYCLYVYLYLYLRLCIHLYLYICMFLWIKLCFFETPFLDTLILLHHDKLKSNNEFVKVSENAQLCNAATIFFHRHSTY